MLEFFDKKIIEKLTKFSHWFQKLTGLTNFFFARIGLLILVSSLIVSVLNYFWPFLEQKNSVLSFIAFVLWVISVTEKVRNTHKAEENLLASEQIKVEKSTSTERKFWLIMALFFSGFFGLQIPAKFLFLEALKRLGFFYGFLIYLYFLEVVPLPPGRSKIREWIGKFSGLFQRVPELETIPVKSD